MKNKILKGAAAGIISGLAAAYMMEKAQKTAINYQEFLKENLSFIRKKGEITEQHSSHEDPATVKAAEAISRKIFHKSLPEENKAAAGEIVHYSFGALMGGLYGVLAEIKPSVTSAAGTAYGTAVWLTADNIGVPLFKLSKSPFSYPVSVHLYGLGSHLVYGLTADFARRLLRKIF